MTIKTPEKNTGRIPLALEKLEELRKLAESIGGEVPNYIRGRDGSWPPVIQISENHIHIQIDVWFPVTSLSQCTPQSGGQSGCNPG
jgi:hypothetical protein